MHVSCLRLLFMVAVLFVIASPIQSADPPATSEQKVLDKWLGSWRTSYKLPKAVWTPEEKSGTAEMTTSRVLGGQFVQEKSEHSDKTSSMLMLTYDTQKKCYRGWWFNSSGQTAEHTGKWDADAKTMTWTSVGEGAFTTTVKHRFVDDDNTDWDVAVKDDKGKMLFRMEGKSVRKK